MMHEDEIEAIAQKVAEKVAVHPASCLMFTTSEAESIKKFIKKVNDIDNVALATTVGFLVLALLGALLVGIGIKIREMIVGN